MTDITMCNGNVESEPGCLTLCPLRTTCYRHTTTPDSGWQAWFARPMELYGDEDGNDMCEMYWRCVDEESSV